MLRSGDILEHKYKINTLIARGGSSKVWLAENIEDGLNRLWAIKELDPKSEIYKKTYVGKDIIPEVDILKKVKHHAFPRIAEAIKTKDSYAIVMEYIQGETLSTILENEGPQDNDTVVSWMLDVCDALSYLHNMDPPVVYRDMKPDNIMLTPDGDIKVIDLNTSRERDDEHKKDTMPLGTTGYASPEHYTRDADARSDVYSTGVTLYSLITGIDPQKTPYLKPLTEVDPSQSTGLEKIILKATNPDRDKRYQTMQELANALESYKKLDDSYIANLRKTLRIFILSGILSLALIIIGSGLFIAAQTAENNTFNGLVESGTTDVEKRIDELNEATKIKPQDPTPYTKIINLLTKDGALTDSDLNRIFGIYNANKESLMRDKKAFAEVNYAIGEACLKYYQGEGDDSTRSKLLTASPYFENATYDKFDKATLAKNYAFIADYYRNFVMPDSSLVPQDATTEDYIGLVSSCENMINELSAYNGDKKGKLKFITAETIVDIIDQERNYMAKANVEKEKLISIMKLTKSLVKDVEAEDTATKRQRNKIIESINSEIDYIEMSYKNKGKTDG